jgi:hypothetical protein
MDTIIFVKASINGVPVSAHIRVQAPRHRNVSQRELETRLLRWFAQRTAERRAA